MEAVFAGIVSYLKKESLIAYGLSYVGGLLITKVVLWYIDVQ